MPCSTPGARSRVWIELVGGALILAGCATAAPLPTATAVPPTTVAAAPFPPPVAANAVRIANFAFGPAAVTVPEGTAVTWTNGDVEQHTVTARDQAFNSDAIANDKTFTVTFTKAGTFNYFCQIHPNMVGEVVVTTK